jgi:hypothetical protein
MMAVTAIISRTRPTVINLRSRHRLPAFELTVCFASGESGSAGNDLGGGDCPSILFNAFRMELKMTTLQNCMAFSDWNVGMQEYWNDGLLDLGGNECHQKPYRLWALKPTRSF